MKSMMWTLVVITVWSGLAAASTDPFVGKWRLDVKQSSYPKGTCPKKMQIKMESTGQGVRYFSESTYANGKTSQAQYTALYNGKQALVLGNRGFLLPVSLKRLDSHTVIASYTRGTLVIATSRRVVSKDGRHMTITTKSPIANGKSVTTIGVYDRE